MKITILLFILYILLILIISHIIIYTVYYRSNTYGGNDYVYYGYSRPLLYYSIKKNDYKLESELHKYGFQYKALHDNAHIIFDPHSNTKQSIIQIYTKKINSKNCFVMESGIIRCFGNKTGNKMKEFEILQKIYNKMDHNSVYYICNNNIIVLNCVVLPSLGLKRRPKSIAETSIDGSLLPFYKSLKNCILIPYNDATSKEIEIAQNIYFNNNFLSLTNLITKCYEYNIFLISHLGKIIGYITFTKDHYIYITIIEEYQNRGIATAMIAQFMEIYHFRIYPLPNYSELNSIYMGLPPQNFNIINKMANKLFFTFNGKYYERPCKMQDIIFNGNKTLTYKIFSINNNTNENFLIKNIEPYMKQSTSNFVHFAMTSYDTKKSITLKSATGSSYTKTFMVQSAELKSSINSKISVMKKNLNEEYFQQNKKSEIIIFFGLYLSKNGVKKLYVMDSYRKKDEYTKIDDTKLKKFISIISNLLIVGDYYIYNESNAGFHTFSIAITSCNNDPTEPKIVQINNYIEGARYKKMTDAEFINYMNAFSDKYYNWLSKCIILPHFGLSRQIKPIALDIAHNILDTFSPISEIIANLSLSAIINSELVTINPKIDIYYEEKNIGHIILQKNNDIITLNHLELHPTHRKKNISSHVLFILMEILAAYYSPNQISLQFIVVDSMIKIANNLKFEKKKDYFIRKCRPLDYNFNSKIEDNTIGIHAFTDIDWVPGTKNFDCGSGDKYKFINEYLLYRFHIKNISYDPYTIPKHINDNALKMVASGNFDTATSMSVLNVIFDKNVRLKHLKLIYSALKKNGIAYFKIYQGDKSGIVNTTRFHQNNLELEYYVGEIKDVFGKIEVINDKNLIIGYK